MLGNKAVGAATADSEKSPKVFHGSPQQMVNTIVSQVAGADTCTFVVSTGTHLIVFNGTQRRGTFALEPSAGQLPAGVFRPHDGKVQQMWTFQDGHTEWLGVAAPDKEHLAFDPVVAPQRDQYVALVRAATQIFILRAEASPDRDGAHDGGGGEETTTDGTTPDGGDGGEAPPPIPEWAHIQFRVVRDRVQYETHHIREIAGHDVEDSEEAIARLLTLAAVPSHVSLGSDGKDALLMVEIPIKHAEGEAPKKHAGSGPHGALALKEGQGPLLVWERVQALTRALAAGQKPTRNATAQDMLLGLPSATAVDADHVAANTESYPSQIKNLGPAIGVAPSVHRFEMSVDFSAEGQFATLAAFGPRAYRWEVFRLRDAGGGLTDTTGPQKVARSAAAGTELHEGFHEIGEDFDASLHEETLDPVTGTAIATDAVVRGIGTLVGSFVSLASTPSNEQGIPWEGPGTYLVRCASARPPLSRKDASEHPVVRAPSIALYPIRVMSAKDIAVQLTEDPEGAKAEGELAQLTGQLDGAPQDRSRLEEQISAKRAEIDRLRAADEEDAAAHLSAADTQAEEQIALTHMVAELRNTGIDPKEWGPLIGARTPEVLRPPKLSTDMLFGQVVGTHVQLALKGREPATVIEELRRVQEQTRKQRGALADVADEMHGPTFRPHMSFVPRSGGQPLPLLIVVGEAAGSKDGARTWRLFDLSTPGHHDGYRGSSSQHGPAGHAEAIRNAVVAFAGDVPYGRGIIGVRLPAGLTAYVEAPIAVPATIDATPNTSARWRGRLESLASAAATAALLVTGPVGIGLGIVGGVAGGVVAGYRLYHRYQGGYLEMDLATAMDITAVVGAVAAPVGALAGTARAGTGAAAAASKWVTIAGRVERGVHIFGYLQLGSQVFAIPLSLAQELAAIDADTTLSPGERAARRAMAFLNATRSGLEALGTAHQMLADHVEVADTTPPDLGAAVRSARETAAARSEAAVGREGHNSRGDDAVSRSREGAKPEPARPDSSPGPAETSGGHAEGARGDGVETGERTAAGTTREDATTRAEQRAGDANPTAKARAVELLEQRLGRRGRSEGLRPVTEAELSARPHSGEDAVALYDRVVHQSAGNEVGLFYNPNTGEFAVRVGSEFSVSPPAGDGWQAIVHLHPNPENVIIRRMPAPADVLGAVHAAMRTGSHTEFVQFSRPDGSTGVSRVEVSVNPARIVVELPAEPASAGHAGEPARTVDVGTPEAYAREYGGDTSHLDPQSALYRWIIRDLDAFYAARRNDGVHGAGEGRTAAGTIHTPGTDGAASIRPAESVEPQSLREELAGRRQDVAALFERADAKHTEENRPGDVPSVAFDAAMATLESRGMGQQGRAAVERLLQPGKRTNELSPGRFRYVVEAMTRTAELIQLRPDLVTDRGLAEYATTVRDLASEVNAAYRRGRTLADARLSTPKSPELGEAMARMNRAVDDQLSSTTSDPVARLLELMTLRGTVARGAETLRSYGPQFTAEVPTVGPRSRDPLIKGIQDRPITVSASGVVGEPLDRNLPGLGLEEYMLPARELAQLETKRAGIGKKLADLRGWQRAHLIGPGFGTELFTGMMLAPESVNQVVQNEGVEHFIRTAAGIDGAEVTVSATAQGRRLEVGLKGNGVEHIDVLTRVDYTIKIKLEGGRTETHSVAIEIGPPPEGAVKVDSTIPADAPGGDVLATFPRISNGVAPGPSTP